MKSKIVILSLAITVICVGVLFAGNIAQNPLPALIVCRCSRCGTRTGCRAPGGFARVLADGGQTCWTSQDGNHSGYPLETRKEESL